MKDLLTDEGKRYAKWMYRFIVWPQRIPFIGKWLSKWVAAMVMTAIFQYVLVEGKNEDGRNRKAKVPKVQNRNSVSSEQRSTTSDDDAQKMRELRVSSGRVRRVSGMVRDSSGNLSRKREEEAPNNSAAAD